MKLEEFLRKKHRKKYKKVLRELLEGYLPKKIKYSSWKDLLKLHRSSRERYLFYDKFYEVLSKFSKFEAIIDIGCGFNPFSLIFSKNIPKKYYAIDYNDKVIEVLEKEKRKFLDMGVDFKVIKEDVIFNTKIIEELLKREENKVTILLMKNLLIFTRIKKSFAKEFANIINKNKEKVDVLVVSFSKFSFSGIRFIYNKEKIEKIFKFFKEFYKEKYEISNEVIYFLKP